MTYLTWPPAGLEPGTQSLYASTQTIEPQWHNTLNDLDQTIYDVEGTYFCACLLDD